MIKVLFVAPHGPAFSGKDTSCALLKLMRSKGTGVVEARFAEPIYDMIRTRVPEANSRMTKEEKERPRAELGGLSIRQMAVSIGEGARQADPNVWIKLWARKCLDDVTNHLLVLGVPNVLVLVPDIRKEGEREAFDDLPGQLLEGLRSAFPYGPVELWSQAVVAHIEPSNAPVNAQFNAATETPLTIQHGDPVLQNDHELGVHGLGRALEKALTAVNPFSKRQLILDLVDFGKRQEVCDALTAPEVRG